MRYASLVLLAATTVPLSIPHGADAAASTGKKARTIVTTMIGRMRLESRATVQGTAKSPKTVAYTYTVRFQASNREEYLALPARHTTGHRAGTQSLHYIFLGHTRYATLDGKRWFRTANPTPPAITDLLALNTDGADCCTASGVSPVEQLHYKGVTSWRGFRVFVITYKGASSAGGSYGNLYVDTASYLPRGYTATTVPDNTSGTFVLTYGGSFQLKAPKV